MIKSILRGVFVFLVGLCLVIWSSQAGEILLKALGVFLILSSVITVVYGLATNSYMDLKGMSLISIASAVLFLVVGLFLLLKTGFFMEFIGFVLGILLAIYGLLQLVVAVRNSKGIKDRFWFFLVPALIFVAGIVFCFFPRYNISVLLLGASEIWMAFKVKALAKRLQAAAQEDADRMRENQNIVVEAIEPEDEPGDEPEEDPEPETTSEEPFEEEPFTEDMTGDSEEDV